MTTPIVLLAIGQSNMASIAAQTGGDTSSDSEVFIWNNSSYDALVNGTQFNVATSGVAPLDHNNANNLAFQTAKALRKKTLRPVYVILCARGAHKIEAFMSDSTLSENGWSNTNAYDLYDFIAANVPNALAAVPGSPSTVDAVIIHQGEANNADSSTLYANKLSAALEDIAGIGDCVDLDATPIIFGEIAEERTTVLDWTFNHSVSIRKVASTVVGRGKVVSSKGLAKVDGVHFTGDALDTYGALYADAIVGSEDITSSARFGLGTTNQMIADTDGIKNIEASGFYRASTNNVSVVGGPSGAKGGTFIKQKWNDLFYSVFYQDVVEGDSYSQVYANGVLKDWRKFYDTGNAVGLMSDDALVEGDGDIDTGQYVKLADGTMLCWVRNITSAANAAKTWAFPETFIENPVCTVTTRYSAGALRVACVESISTTGVSFRTASLSGDESKTPNVDIQVMGRWK